MGPPVGYLWRHVVLQWSVTRVPSRHLTFNFPLGPLLVLDWRSERPDPINRLVMLNSSIYITKSQSYSTNCFYAKQTPSPFYLIGARSGDWIGSKNYHFFLLSCVTCHGNLLSTLQIGFCLNKRFAKET